MSTSKTAPWSELAARCECPPYDAWLIWFVRFDGGAMIATRIAQQSLRTPVMRNLFLAFEATANGDCWAEATDWCSRATWADWMQKQGVMPPRLSPENEIRLYRLFCVVRNHVSELKWKGEVAA